MEKLEDYSPSPNGDLLYVTSQYNMTTLETRRILWLKSERGDYKLKSDCAQPFWFSNSTVGAICHGQIWSCNLNLPIMIWNQVTKGPEITSAQFNSHSSNLVFSTKVLPNSDLKSFAIFKEYANNNPENGIVYDQLFVRHWDTFLNPMELEQLFSVKVKVGLTVRLQGEPQNLMKDTMLESPVAPYGSNADYDFSVDGNLLAFAARVPGKDKAWNTNIDVYVVKIDGSEAPISLSSYNLGSDTSPRFSPSGKHLAWLQMQTPGYEADHNQIVYLNLETLETKTFGWDDKSPSEFQFLNSTTIVFCAPYMGFNSLFSLNIDDGTVERLTHSGSFRSIHVGTDATFGLWDSMTNSANLFKVFPDGSAEPFVELNQELLSQRKLSKPIPFSFPMGDYQSHGWVLEPYGYDSKKGPESFWADSWSYRWNPQMWASHGYFVVMVNPEGSTSYGSNYTREILGNWGGSPFKTLMRGVQVALELYPQIDPKRVAAAGASYGGYMINWINSQTDQFACLVSHDGVFNTRGWYYTTEELWFPESEFLGTPDTQGNVYDKWNPMNFVGNMKTPTLIIHGEKDYRIPVTEGISVFTALQRMGVESKLLYFPDENHWVLKPANWIQWQREILQWMDKFTKN